LPIHELLFLAKNNSFFDKLRGTDQIIRVLSEWKIFEKISHSLKTLIEREVEKLKIENFLFFHLPLSLFFLPTGVVKEPNNFTKLWKK
jgi:hypothetical protein